MVLFDNRETKDFLLFVKSFQMTLEASGTIFAGSNIHYLYMLINGEALHQIDTFSSEVGITTPEQFKTIILNLGTYFFLLMCCPKKHAMRRGTRKSHV